MKNKHYSLKNSLSLLTEFKMSSSAVSLNTIDDFFKIIEKNEIVFNMQNNSSYNYLSFKEILLICCLLEELKNDQLNETITLKYSIKKEFSFLFEQINQTAEFSIDNFASFLRSLVHKISNMNIREPVWKFKEENNESIFKCDYFEMKTEGEYANSNKGVNTEKTPAKVTVKINDNFEDLVIASAFIKKNAGFYFEDLLLSLYSNNKEINIKSSTAKEKIAYIITILLKYDRSRDYSNILFSQSFQEMSGYNFDSINYENMLNMHKQNVEGFPTISNIGNALFDSEKNIEIVNANSIQHNCGFDFLILGPNSRGSIIDLKTHHASSPESSGFNVNSISTNTIHFLNSILRVVNNNDIYKALNFNSIGLFKVKWEINSKKIKIKKFKMRYDLVNDFVNDIKVDTKSLNLTDNHKEIDLKTQILFDQEKVIQNYQKINVSQAYDNIFNKWLDQINKFLNIDENKDIIIPDGKITLEGDQVKKEFIKVIKAIVSSSVIKDYEQTKIFSDENKIKIIRAFVIHGEDNIDYIPDSPITKPSKPEPDVKKIKKHKINAQQYFYNSTLVLTIMNNLSLDNKNNPKFTSLLSIANDINAKGNEQKNSLRKKHKDGSVDFRKRIEDILN